MGSKSTDLNYQTHQLHSILGLWVDIPYPFSSLLLVLLYRDNNAVQSKDRQSFTTIAMLQGNDTDCAVL